jgi:hypothetical protein
MTGNDVLVELLKSFEMIITNSIFLAQNFQYTFLQSLGPIFISISMFGLILVFYWLGFYFQNLRAVEIRKLNTGGLTGVLWGLLGLVLAFTFSMANSRYEKRRDLTVQEANDIGTAYIRTAVYPDSIHDLFKIEFGKYIDARVNFYHCGRDVEKVNRYYKQSDSMGMVIWGIATSFSKVDKTTTLTSQLLPALNNMIDIKTTRRSAGESTIPDSIMYFVFFLCICSAFILGYDNKKKIDWLLVTCVSLMISITIFTIVDLDRPRSGLIRMDPSVQKIIELKDLFKP